MSEFVTETTLQEILDLGLNPDQESLAAFFAKAQRRKGGEGSGHFGHAGRPGHVGGSKPSGRAADEPSELSAWKGRAIQPWKEKSTISPEAMDRWLLEGLCEEPDPADCEQDWTKLRNSAEAIKAKEEIVQKLAEMTGLDEKVVNRLIQRWAFGTFGADNRLFAIHTDAAELFGSEVSENLQGRIQEAIDEAQAIVDSWTFEDDGERYPTKEAYAEWVYKMTATGEKARRQFPADVQKRVLQAMYHWTQQDLRERLGAQPGDTIDMWRGIQLPYEMVKDLRPGDRVPVTGNPLQSWSIGQKGADYFAQKYLGPGEVGIMLRASVPIERVLGTARTGFGCLAEGEMVVIGPSDDDSIMIWDMFGYEAAAERASAKALQRLDLSMPPKNANWMKHLPGYEGEAELHDTIAEDLEAGAKGGEGSGHFGHEGRPGHVGGSKPSGRAEAEPWQEDWTWPGDFESIEDLEAWAEKQFPWMKFGLKGMDLELANEILEQWQFLVGEFPDAAQVVQYLGLATDEDNPEQKFCEADDSSWASVYPNERILDGKYQMVGSIVLTDNHWKDADKLRRSLESSTSPYALRPLDWENTFHPEGITDVSYILSHEFGHVIDMWVKRNLPADTAFERVVDHRDGVGLVGALLLNWDVTTAANAGKISQYAKFNSRELLAEAVGALYHQPRELQHQSVKNLGILLQIIGKAPKYHSSEIRFLHELSGQEWQDALNRLNQVRQQLVALGVWPEKPQWIKGGPGSGHFGHEGRPGEVGGSKPSKFGPEPEVVEQAAMPPPGSEEIDTEGIALRDVLDIWKLGMDIDKLTEFAEARWPWMQWGLDGMDPELADKVVRQFARLAAEYPEVARTIKYVGLDDHWDHPDPNYHKLVGPYAHAGSIRGGFDRHISLASNFWSVAGKEKLLSALDASQAAMSVTEGDIGWHAPGCDTPESIITHEFGHGVESWAGQTYELQLMPFKWPGPSHLGIPSAAVNIYKENQFKYASKVSGYAMTSKGEFFAEAFSSLHHTPKKQQAVTVKKLQKLLDVIRRPTRHWTTVPDIPTWYEANPDERLAAYEAMAPIVQQLHAAGATDRDEYRSFMEALENARTMAERGGWSSERSDQKGGPGSGHHGHAGRPGFVGGSKPSGRAPEEPAVVQPVTEPAVEPEPSIKPKVLWPGHFQAAEDLEAWAEEQFPGVNFNFEHMDLASAEMVMQQFLKLAEAYPEAVRENLGYFGSTQGDHHARDDTTKWWPEYATAFTANALDEQGNSTGKRGIYFTKEWIDPEEQAIEWTESADAGFLVSPTPEGTVTHEFGHVVDDWLRGRKEALVPYQTYKESASINRIVREWKGLNRNRWAYQVSKYAGTNEEEFFAETFTAIWHVPENEQPKVVQNLRALLRRFQEGPTYSEFRHIPAEPTYFSTENYHMTYEEYQAAREQLRAIYGELVELGALDWYEQEAVWLK